MGPWKKPSICSLNASASAAYHPASASDERRTALAALTGSSFGGSSISATTAGSFISSTASGSLISSTATGSFISLTAAGGSGISAFQKTTAATPKTTITKAGRAPLMSRFFNCLSISTTPFALFRNVLQRPQGTRILLKSNSPCEFAWRSFTYQPRSADGN